MGVGCAAMVTEINTAASAHCLYYSTNSGSCTQNPHAEVQGCDNFYAERFDGRMRLAGYSGSPMFEDMAFSGSPTAAVRMWIDSIWHRTPVLSPWAADLGYGNAQGCDTMDFGRGNAMAASTVATYPYDGQTSVPTSFSGNEGPRPPAPATGWPSGYPIHLYIQNAQITEHVLTVDGDTQEIAHTWLTPADQQLLRTEYVMYADDPLQGGTTYRVRVGGQHSGASFTREWTFTTR